MKRQEKRGASRKGFTLIELMVVIGIMLLIMSVLFPAFNHARRTAQRTRARTDIHTIQAAIVAYHREYNRYPMQTAAQAPAYTGASYKNLIDILKGSNVGNNNTRSIQFLEVSKGSHSDQYGMVDPWGQLYSIQVDARTDTVRVSSPGNPDPRFREELTTE